MLASLATRQATDAALWYGLRRLGVVAPHCGGRVRGCVSRGLCSSSLSPTLWRRTPLWDWLSTPEDAPVPASTLERIGKAVTTLLVLVRVAAMWSARGGGVCSLEGVVGVHPRCGRAGVSECGP